MPATVLRDDPGTIGRAQIQSGAPVRGITWGAVARAVNFLNGSPRALIPHCSPNVTLAVADGVQTLSFRVFPSYQATHRLWLAVLEPTAQDEAIGTEFEFTDPSGGTATWRCIGTAGPFAPKAFRHVETVSSRTTSETTLAPTFESIAGTHVLGRLACFELPRPELAVDANDLGLELGSFRARHWIYDATGRSLGGLPEALAGALSRGRRHMFQWARPATAALAFSTTSTSYTSVLTYTPELLERYLYNGDTTPTIEVRVLAWVTGGTGDVAVTMANGDLNAVAISATTPTWTSITGLNVRAEDLSASDGRRTSADLATIQARKNTSGTIYVAGIGIIGRAS